MAISTEKAYEILNLPLGAAKDAIEQSYKKLAVKWHPEKYTTNKNIQEALKNFKAINIAYRKLIYNERDDKDITLHEMFEQYRQVFHYESLKKSKLLAGQTTNVDIKNSNKNTLLELNNNNNFINNKNLNSQNNSNSNISQQKQFEQMNNKNTKLKLVNDKNNNNEENYENQYQPLRREDQIEQTLLAKKMAQTLALKGNELAKQGDFLKAIEKFTEAIKYDPNDQRLFGNRSYCYDKIGQFQEALNDATKAISIEPLWAKGYFRKGRALYGLKCYKEAEEAYENVLTIETIDDPELEEELYKVRSLQLQEMGFSKIQSENAIRTCGTVQAALETILMCCDTDKSNESCSDIDNNELDYVENDSENGEDMNTFAKKLQSNLAPNSINNKFKTVPVNLKIKSASSNSSNSSTSNSIETDKFIEINNQSKTNKDTNSNSQSVPSTSLWIGNVDPNVTEEMLSELFSAYGQLSNVRCLPEKYCAFVNFKSKEDAQRALTNLQGKNLEGQRILIKYPDNPNTAILGTLLAKNQTTNKTGNDKKIVDSKLKKKPDEISKILTDANGLKLSGPVNGNECYFWRTTGCLYGDKCHYEHVKKNKGVDKKPWHK